ncbi:Glutathione S-transferase family protein [Rhodovastum atsumiense]|uniref:Glutathione S-transferase n=1 Tax=Rhodovastum atsumiense TaxID=504468 RepID=A0A5M6IVZ7_9PROT|nr:glutathione S-transferase N-terminal domain-containing protein [Rhodovastum atsumiense]KAA5612391.1 glutathione S-transferase [Rhodovastum atsumiense]CAH2600295.1 Glutathione S-transferase family protein [Rhodovastum atsumiense]
MKLFHSSTSPYVRKVMACAIAREIERQIELVPTNPHESPAELLASNPLSKVPCLITDDGLALFDSPVICEYLDSLDGAVSLYPRTAGGRWKALKYQALADGIMDAAVLRRMEAQRPEDPARQAVIARQGAVVQRSLDELEKDPPHRVLDIGTISVACALGYLDLRFPADDWRRDHPALATWFAAISREPALARTAPPAA